ncbi:MAG: rhodanese-like domain-containing protein [Pyrinomonadaceae bacterium]|nr:rhodanese-like domain-containing protein [Pyrinomonadaceae bacterium]
MRFIFTIMLAASLAVLIACQSSAAPTKIEPIAKTTPTAAPAAVDTHNHSDDENAPRISLADAKKAFDAGEAIFVDTRFADAFALEHIKGAINVPANEFDTAYNKIPKGKKIIAYCS